MTKTKGLLLLIFILFISNLVAWFMLFNKKHVKTSRHAQTREFLRKEVGFSGVQLAAYDSLANAFREEFRKKIGEAKNEKVQLMEKVAANGFSDSAIAVGSRGVAEAQRQLEMVMLTHTANVRALCTPAQTGRFDDGWIKMFRRKIPGKQ